MITSCLSEQDLAITLIILAEVEIFAVLRYQMPRFAK